MNIEMNIEIDKNDQFNYDSITSQPSGESSIDFRRSVLIDGFSALKNKRGSGGRYWKTVLDRDVFESTAGVARLPPSSLFLQRRWARCWIFIATIGEVLRRCRPFDDDDGGGRWELRRLHLRFASWLFPRQLRLNLAWTVRNLNIHHWVTRLSSMIYDGSIRSFSLE